MNKGKVTCEKLKAIRREVAEKLGIEYAPKECTFEGECPGTCPLCQQETDWLMEQVNIRLQENPELISDIQCKVSEMYHMEKGDDDNPEEIFELGMPREDLLEGLVDVGDEPFEGEVEETLMGDVVAPKDWDMIATPGIVSMPITEEIQIRFLCNYIYCNTFPVDSNEWCFYHAEKFILDHADLWQDILSAEDQELAFTEVFAEMICRLFPETAKHLLFVYFAEYPTYKTQVMKKVLPILKGDK